MLWEPPRYIYAHGISGQQLQPYGLRHKYVVRTRGLGQPVPTPGLPPGYDPTTGQIGSKGICLDQNQNSISCTDPNCTYGDCGATGPQITSGSLCLDPKENQISCSDPTCTYGDCISPTQPPNVVGAGAPTGSVLVYQGTWQAFPTLNPNTIISRVAAALPQVGLQVTNQQTDASVVTIGNFNVNFTLQVTGPGFGNASDAGLDVNHAYYTVTGHMPVSGATFLQSAVSGIPRNLPGTTPSTTSMTSWFEQNAGTVGLLAVAIVVIPALIKKI